MSRANTPNGTRNGKRRSVYLDDATVEAARAMGDGNIGEGIRRALASRQSATPIGYAVAQSLEWLGAGAVDYVTVFAIPGKIDTPVALYRRDQTAPQ